MMFADFLRKVEDHEVSRGRRPERDQIWRAAVEAMRNQMRDRIPLVSAMGSDGKWPGTTS